MEGRMQLTNTRYNMLSCHVHQHATPSHSPSAPNWHHELTASEVGELTATLLSWNCCLVN